MTEKKRGEPELFFGVVGAVGTDLNKVCKSLERTLARVKYESKTIVLSSSLTSIEGLGIQLNTEKEYERIKSFMDAGDELRKKTKDGSSMALLSLREIIKFRTEKTGDKKTPAPRQAYILKSLKHEAEVDLLQKIYSRNFWTISAYSPRDVRVKNLATKIASTAGSGLSEGVREHAEQLVERDQHDKNTKFGQNVRQAFPEGDVFINAEDSKPLDDEIDRFVDLLFGNTFHTPTKHEYGMFHAYASSLKSSSMARQVGAAITTEEGDIVSTGTNEVPKFGGGVYGPEDKPDKRDFALGQYANDIKQIENLKDVFNRLQEEKWLNDEKKDKNVSDLVDEALQSEKLSNMRFLNLTEFGREVHAEMAALLDASRSTVSIKDGILFCTIFPCHVCAKHIIGAGIKIVYYIEPYPKSLAKDLFSEIISVDEEFIEGRVHFKPYVGISPKRYIGFFKMMKRKKEDGSLLEWEAKEANLRYTGSLSYPEKETIAINKLNQLMTQNQLKFT